jgi:hypothetical protein
VLPFHLIFWSCFSAAELAGQVDEVGGVDVELVVVGGVDCAFGS